MKTSWLITHRILPLTAVTVASLALGGCVSTVKSVVTAPFKVVGQTADWATTSQDEADRNRGRKDRKAEAHENKERRAREKQEQRNGTGY